MSDLVWRPGPPSPDEVRRSEEYFWVRGGNFNRAVMVRANAGARSEPAPTPEEPRKRRFWGELNFQFYCDGYPDHIWSGDLHQYLGLQRLEWAGPVPRPPE